MAARAASSGLVFLCASLLGSSALAAPSSAAKSRSGRHPYQTRGVNENRSGYFPDGRGPFPLGQPSWIYGVPFMNRHQTAVIDEDFNVYTGSDNGVVQSWDRIGRLRWTVQVGDGSVQNPGIQGSVLYTATGHGDAVAMDKDTGREIWRNRISDDGLPGDTYSPSAFDDFVVYPGGKLFPYGSPDVICVNARDGSVRWRYSVGDKYGGTTGEMAKNGIGPKYSTVNLAPCFWRGVVIFNDVSGAVFALDLKDGRELWYTAGDDKDMYTLGSLCCGPNGKVYMGMSTDPGVGALQVLDIRDGTRLWRTSYPREVHSAPAVGYINGVLTAVNGIGEPSGYPVRWHLNDWWESAKIKFLQWVGQAPVPNFTGEVHALNAETGEKIWTFEPPPWHDYGCAGSTIPQVCLPDLWSAPTIDAAGTVWINWSAGGILYGLRDANGDGRVDINDPKETTAYDCGSAATGPPAVADGFVVTVTCRKVLAFSSV